MAEEVEVETKELRETLTELQEERREREEADRRTAWTRYIALTTALLAVFAAVGALESSGLVNEAMISQLRASDLWNEYQADRQKQHLFEVSANSLLDRGAKLPAPPTPTPTPAPTPTRALPERPPAKKSDAPEWRARPPEQRLRQYIQQANKEAEKETELKEAAEHLQQESEDLMHRHHQFALSVAFIQVAIALSAVAALTRMRSVWGLSLLVGLAGVYFFTAGFRGHG
jgi:hypothetical protein